MRHDRVQLHRVIAMLIIFALQLCCSGCSTSSSARRSISWRENMVDRKMFGGWEFPVGWFQSVSPLAIIVLAPLVSR